MPELPEVQTTVNGLQKHIVGLKIRGVWTSYNSSYFKGSETIKDPLYFKKFKKEIIGRKVITVSRRAKNVLIYLSSKTVGQAGKFGDKNFKKIILVHMKMTGHLLYGTYKFNARNKNDPWEAVESKTLQDPYNKHVRFLISFSNNKHLALSDVRKFAKVTLIDGHDHHLSDHLKNIGPEPLEKSFNLEKFSARINLKLNGKIKQVLMDQSVVAGIGNIYADESLWRAGIHPLERVKNIKHQQLEDLFSAIQTTLSKGIDFGGDSTSDYRNVLGNKGKFHETHHAYQRTGDKCDKKNCGGTIVRIIIGSRSTHYCNKHQKIKFSLVQNPKKKNSSGN
ncbi:MAG: bifunctional DNA-formamidopyrimidine glycosylase/DNA-(apurinic or apyrimidinic site) lyase [Patescibacteria group bacterium]